MSDEIIDVNAESVEEEKFLLQCEKDLPQEKLSSDGVNLADPNFVESGLSPEGAKAMEQARQDVANLPPYPTEWQQDYKEDTKGFDEAVDPLKINVSFKEQEMKKIIKKYKRYLKSNITEVKRLESE